MLARNDVLPEPTHQDGHLAFQSAPIDELEHVQAGVVGEREHGPERRLEPFGVQAVDVVREARRGAEDLGKGFTEAAGRFESLVELQVDHAFSFADSGQCHAHPPRTVIGVEAHSAIALELAARGRRIDAPCARDRIREAALTGQPRQRRAASRPSVSACPAIRAAGSEGMGDSRHRARRAFARRTRRFHVSACARDIPSGRKCESFSRQRKTGRRRMDRARQARGTSRRQVEAWAWANYRIARVPASPEFGRQIPARRGDVT